VGISYGIMGFDDNDLMDLRITSVLDLRSVTVAAAVG
jgi:energy-converting hydrogenase Eha subunit G